MSFGIYRPKPTIYFISKEIQGHDLAISATLNSNILTIQAFATELSQKTNKQNKSNQNKTKQMALQNITSQPSKGVTRGNEGGGQGWPEASQSGQPSLSFQMKWHFVQGSMGLPNWGPVSRPPLKNSPPLVTAPLILRSLVCTHPHSEL